MSKIKTNAPWSILKKILIINLIVILIALTLVILYFVFPQTWTEPDDYIEGLHGEKIYLTKGKGYYRRRRGLDHYVLVDEKNNHTPLSENNRSNKSLSRKNGLRWQIYAWGFDTIDIDDKHNVRLIDEENILIIDDKDIFTIVDSHWVCETGFTFDQNDTHFLVLKDDDGELSYIRTHFIDHFNNSNFSILSVFNLINKRGLKCWVKGF